ncbi:MAG TPA: 23S rRNA (pseudouridine(1915)-N(3))-methyltransferase RlmH [Burkholderiaceae bacterium]|nr:23S rRNA (pseudouridine(1915)-N(3))-methyltransferase RlmH [Burkholderiaceae bacterium]
MNIHIVAVGHRLPRWAQEATDEYLNRFPATWRVAVKAIKAVDPDSAPLDRVLQTEAQRMVDALPAQNLLIALDERGQTLTTAQLAHTLQAWRDDNQTPCFVIGGANGLAPSIKAQAQHTWRLSSLTLPHALARVVLAEQLYRAWSMLAAHPYHRA